MIRAGMGCILVVFNALLRYNSREQIREFQRCLLNDHDLGCCLNCYYVMGQYCREYQTQV